MSWEGIRTILGFLSLVLSICAIWLARRDRSSDAQKKAVEKIVQTNDERHAENIEQFKSIGTDIATLTERIEHLPDSDDIGKVYDAINQIRSSVDRMQGSNEQMSSMLARINNFMIGMRTK
ncbi:hypothetical protein [Hydrocarboniphaga effusa]|uniref:hypothetical protein n=1 Tax=Hydrocarboniphaga effusa TaxID=243629 RepID=UPI003BA8BBEB